MYKCEGFRLQVIASHMNTDFDALASMVAAQKLFPQAQIVISPKQHIAVKQFLNIYRDMFDFALDRKINWTEVEELILVDVANIARVSRYASKQLSVQDTHIIVYDHHLKKPGDVVADVANIEQVGATVTLLLEEIKRNNIHITPFEATLFGLGLYTDTGFFTYQHTTARDLQVASFLREWGMNLELIERFTEQTLQPEQQKMLDHLFLHAMTREIDGLEIVLSSCQHDKVISDLAVITEKLLDLKGADAAIIVVGMKKHVVVTGRANSERITLRPLLRKFGGGGHKHAASATIKRADLVDIYKKVKKNLCIMIKPAITARDIMTAPVKTIPPETTMEKAEDLMYRYEHSGYPVVKQGQIVGIITRRDLDKANRHGLGHAPVKGYMSTNVLTIGPNATLEEIQRIVIEHNVGRLPVIEEEKLIGIISRTDMIRALHQDELLDAKGSVHESFRQNVRHMMERQLEPSIFPLLQKIGQTADQYHFSVYLIGGIVRDILLEKPSTDIDIVVEGDGIKFSEVLCKKYGGKVFIHDSFGTSTWTHPNGLRIDVASSRLEYYDHPAQLPEVEASTLRKDLYRRDFTINAMAICLNEKQFGHLVDPFAGQRDLTYGLIKVLHNLSFVEDPTRILRAVRFELRLDFRMDQQTEQLARQSVDQVKDLSKDRIIAEMKQLFQEHQPDQVIGRLFDLRFWKQFDINDTFKKPSCAHAEKLYNVKPKTNDDWLIYFLIPFYHSEKVEIATQFARTKRDVNIIEEIITLGQLKWKKEQTIGSLHRLLRNFSSDVVMFYGALSPAHQQTLLTDYIQKRHHLVTYITGDDLLALDIRPGPIYSKIFLEIEIAVLQGLITSKEEAIDWVKQYLKHD